MGKSPYPKEFCDEVVAIALRRERPISQIAKDFGISGQTIYEWIKKADRDDGISAPPNIGADIENQELKKRNRLLEQENEVLRRATAYFSQAVLPK